MVKLPVAGLVKTRLAAEMGVAIAARFARHAASTLLQRVGRDARWETTIAVAPDYAASSPIWPRGLRRQPQGRGDLGARMQRIMQRAVRGPVVIIGTDVPAIRPSHIQAAFRLLGRHDAVFGAATDGGYWLIGLRRRPRILNPFAAVRWSTPHALSDTLANVRGHSIALVATLADVDTASDFVRHAAAFGRRVRSP